MKQDSFFDEEKNDLFDIDDFIEEGSRPREDISAEPPVKVALKRRRTKSDNLAAYSPLGFVRGLPGTEGTFL